MATDAIDDLTLSALRGDDTRVAELLRRGVDIDARDQSEGRCTALEAAIEGLHLSTIRLLLEAGANVNSAHPYGGATPLHLSVDCECEEAISREDAGERGALPADEVTRVLLAAGADVTAGDAEGLTPLDWAILRDHDRAAQLMNKRAGSR